MAICDSFSIIRDSGHHQGDHWDFYSSSCLPQISLRLGGLLFCSSFLPGYSYNKPPLSKVDLTYLWHLKIEKNLINNDYGSFRRRQLHPTPVLLPGKSHGPRSLRGYSPWSHKESDTTERLHFHFHFVFTRSSSLPWGEQSSVCVCCVCGVYVCMLVAQSFPTLWDSWTGARQAPLSIDFFRQEYGQPFPSPGYLPHPRIEPGSPALQADSLPSEPPGKSSIER